MKEQDEDEEAIRRWRSKATMKKQGEYDKNRDGVEGERRIWRSNMKMKEQDEDGGARRR